MEPSQELVDAIYRERVLRARRTPPEEKFRAGPRLFERACRIMKEGIRHQHPEADERWVEQILRERLALQRRIEETP